MNEYEGLVIKSETDLLYFVDTALDDNNLENFLIFIISYLYLSLYYIIYIINKDKII